MRIQLTDKFWNKVNDHQEKVKGALIENDFLTYDQLCYVTAGEDIDDEFEATPYLIFRSNVRYDRHDFPEEKKVYLDDETYFDTVAFEVISSDQVLDQLEVESGEHKCKCNCNSERNITKDLVLKLAAALEDSYLGKIDEQCTYLEPAIKSILNEVIQFKRDEEYLAMNILEKMEVLIQQCREDQKRCRTSYESDSIERMTFKKILEELVEFGLINIVNKISIQPQIAGEDTVPFDKQVISALVEKFRYNDHSEEQ